MLCTMFLLPQLSQNTIFTYLQMTSVSCQMNVKFTNRHKSQFTANYDVGYVYNFVSVLPTI
jgi:hypothetical protein